MDLVTFKLQGSYRISFDIRRGFYQIAHTIGVGSIRSWLLLKSGFYLNEESWNTLQGFFMNIRSAGEFISYR